MIYGSLCFSGVQEKLTFWHTRISSGDCMNGLVARRRIGVIHLRRDDECSKNSGEGEIHNLLKIQIVQKVCLAQSRIGRGRDCMNRLVCRRRIGVIHLHRDDRCKQLWDIYSLSLGQDSQVRGLPTMPLHPLFEIRKFLLTSQYDVETAGAQKRLNVIHPLSSSLSPAPNQCQCHCRPGVSVAGLLVTTSVVCP